MSSGEGISAGDSVEPEGGVHESFLTRSHFSGKTEPASILKRSLKPGEPPLLSLPSWEPRLSCLPHRSGWCL